nr:RuBisCO long chain, Form III-b [uncultured archaeon]
MSQYLHFVDLSYTPSRSDLICVFCVRPAKGVSFKEAAGRVAAESSNGTWTELTTLKPHIDRLRARCFKISGDWIWVAYPLELFELGNMPQIWSSVAGNIFGMKALSGLRLEDIQFPAALLKSFPGPQFGISGVRKLMNIKNRPLTATVPKPKIGMTTAEHADVLFNSWLGGIDFGKDDENLTSQVFNKFEPRVKTCLRLRDKAEKITGERKSYFINITADSRTMEKRAKFVANCGGEYVMVDICTAGWAGLQHVRDVCSDYKLAIHAHRAFHAAFDRNPLHGLSMLTLAKCARLVGVDNLHIGTVVGKLVGSLSEVQRLHAEVAAPSVAATAHLLGQNWGSVKSVLPTSSGGLHPGLVPAVMHILGPDICLQAGGGIHGHPSGSLAGARALRQAIDATLHHIPLATFARTHSELASALFQWGVKGPV